MKMIVIHRGIEEICTDRNKPIHKHTIMFPTSVSLEEVSEYVLNYLEKRYNMDKKKLIVNSKENVVREEKTRRRCCLTNMRR